MDQAQEIVLIGGSAGSFQVITEILEAMPKHIESAICVVIHRNPNFSTRIEASLTTKLQRPILSVEDKMVILKNHVYFAPPGYHLLVEPNYTFSLDSSDPIHFSRPSIDVLFETCAQVYKEKCTAFLLSGANKDGSKGLKTVKNFGGKTYIQDPSQALINTMPVSATHTSPESIVLKNKEIIDYFCLLP